MLRRPSLCPILATLFIFAATAFPQTAVQSRISSVSNSSRVALPHTVPPRALTGADLGAAPSDRVLDTMTLIFSRTAAQQAALDQLLINLQDPKSSQFQQWLNPEQFGAQFGLSAADLGKVTAWLASQGFTVTSTARSSNFVTFTGTVGQAEKAFGTSIHTVMIDGESHISNVTDPVLPAGIAGVVAGFAGLNDIKLKSRARTRVVQAPATNSVTPQFTSAASGTHYVSPKDFNTIYDVNPLLNTSTGSGITIAVVGQTDISISDVSSFRAASGLSTTNLPAVYCIKTNTAGVITSAGIVTTPANAPACIGSSSSDLPEAQLDVEWSGAVAPAASILYVNSLDVLNISLVQAINNNLAPIISISYGLCEANAGPSSLAAYNQLFQQANAQGQTIIGPAGDSGATDCDNPATVASGGLAVDFPASSPNVTGMGGTTFNEGTGTYWAAASGTDVISSALSYIPEAVWNETTASIAAGGTLSAGGGGASLFFAKPSWQVGTGVPADQARDVPDLSLNAASGHDGYLFCTSGSCTNGFRNAAGNLNVVGGTSVAAPSFAGILALIEQKIQAKIGNANPTIYGLANLSTYNSIFHDTTTGNNSSPCVAGTLNCPNGGSIGYNATTGYDLATGWGTIDATVMANTWTSVTPAGTIIATNKTSSFTTVATSTSLCAVSAGSSLLLNITVGNGGTTGTAATPVPPSVIPTGSVNITVDNVVVGTANLVNGAVSYTLVTSTLSSGLHTIGAIYSGDTNYTTSRGTLGTIAPASQGGFVTPTPIDIVSSTQADFAFTPCSASTTAVAGGTATGVVFTIRPVQNFSGSVVLTAGSSDSFAGTYKFSVTPVTVSAGASTTTTFTLMAFQTNATTSTGRLRMQSSTTNPIRQIPWYASGSGVTIAGLLLFALPRRRRLGALLALTFSVAAIGVSGCGSGPVSAPGTSTSPTQTNAARGTYVVTVTATSGSIVHSANVTFTVQ